MIKAILFDKDGTLIDFDATFGPATAAVIADIANGDPGCARALTESAFFDTETNGFDPASFLIAGSLEDIARGWLEPAGRNELQSFVAEIDDLYRKHSLASLSIFGFTTNTLTELRRRGLSLGIATNDSEEAALAHAERLGIRDFFDVVMGFDSGHGAKPGPGMVRAFAVATGTKPGEVMMVGDTLHDCQAGRAAAATVVAVTSGRWDTDYLLPHADHVLPDISHLPGLLDDLEKSGS